MKTKLAIVAVLSAALVAPAAAGFAEALAGALGWTVELAVILASHQPRLKEMYLDHFGPNGPSGVIHPTLTVVAGGGVTDVKIESDTLGDEAFAEAIRNEVGTWKMPESAANMTLGFDLTFDPEQGIYGVEVSQSP